MANDGQKKSMVLKALDTVERVGNRLPDPAVIFLILTGIVILVSALCGFLGLSVTYDFLDRTSGEITKKTVEAVSLLAPDSIRYMVTAVVPNFTGFFALGTVFTIMIGVGVADGTGFMSALLRRVASSSHRRGGVSWNHVQHCLIHRLCGPGPAGRGPVHGLWASPGGRAGSSLCRCIRRLERQSFNRHQ